MCSCAGLGGGYCERDNVEYIDREESDDEIDEVSQNTKFACVLQLHHFCSLDERKRNSEKNQTTMKRYVLAEVQLDYCYVIFAQKKEEEKQDEEEEEDDESVDLSKYELVDSDAEGDSDADVSKYDLATSDAEDNQSEQKTSVSAGGRVVG